MFTPGAAPGTGQSGGYTYTDYLALDDGKRYELIEGVLLLTPAPGIVHQHVLAKLAAALAHYVEQNNLGIVLPAPLDMVLDEHLVLQPDLSFISRSRYRIITASCLRGAPDLVVEVLSPSSQLRDRVQKSKIYHQYGVKEYWLADPLAQTVEILSAAEQGWLLAGACGPEDTLHSPLLPGLALALTAVFALPDSLQLGE
ncbi:MAG: Uma2 family endonuclease [Desulfurispora sp.]|uniref:Uma2 family endonuclease n=1 Tax=Desulfurispora sp. TaxID=3014275 RepID=UPI00404A60B5